MLNKNKFFLIYLEKESSKKEEPTIENNQSTNDKPIQETSKKSSQSSPEKELQVKPSPATKDNNQQEISQTEKSKPIEIKEDDEIELLQMRKALLEQTVSKKIIKPTTPISFKKKRNPPVIDLTSTDIINIKTKPAPVLNISNTPNIIVPGEIIE